MERLKPKRAKCFDGVLIGFRGVTALQLVKGLEADAFCFGKGLKARRHRAPRGCFGLAVGKKALKG